MGQVIRKCFKPPTTPLPFVKPTGRFVVCLGHSPTHGPNEFISQISNRWRGKVLIIDNTDYFERAAGRSSCHPSDYASKLLREAYRGTPLIIIGGSVDSMPVLEQYPKLQILIADRHTTGTCIYWASSMLPLATLRQAEEIHLWTQNASFLLLQAILANFPNKTYLHHNQGGGEL